VKRALLDTSYILYCLEVHRDPLDLARTVEGVSDVYIPLYVMDELYALTRGRGRRSRLAAVAVNVLERLHSRGGVKVIDPPIMGDVDSSLLLLAMECSFVLLTADRGLKQRARSAGVEVYSPVSSKAGGRIA